MNYQDKGTWMEIAEASDAFFNWEEHELAGYNPDTLAERARVFAGDGLGDDRWTADDYVADYLRRV